MTTYFSSQLRKGLRVAAWLLLATLIASAYSALRSQPAQAAGSGGPAYGYPVKPFDRQHPIRGGFGDPRTVFNAPPTHEGVYHGSGSFSFHEGVDISAPNGTAVFPVMDGSVTIVDTAPDHERVVVSSGYYAFEYWHISAAVRVGDHVTTGRTVLGHILRGAGHVHLTEIDGGRVTDPLLPGHLTPYRDTTTPEVKEIQLTAGDDVTMPMANFVRGSVQPIVEAYDSAAVPVPGQWHDMPVAPALITWRVETWSGKVVLPERTAWDTRVTIPSNSLFWRYYARGTYQNMAVFGEHYSWGQPGCFLFRLGTLDTRRLHDNVYRLVVTATDIRGNRSSSSIRFSVHNKPGWVGV
jgi:Peptidase family M23